MQDEVDIDRPGYLVSPQAGSRLCFVNVAPVMETAQLRELVDTRIDIVARQQLVQNGCR